MSVKQVNEWVAEVGAMTDVLLHGRHDNVVFTSGEILRFAELVAAKAGEVMRERCCKVLFSYPKATEIAIRALPPITFDDLSK